MRWRRVKKPRDVIDQRGARPAGGRLGGGMSGLPAGLALPGGLGLVGVIIYIAIQVFFSGDGGGFNVPTGFGSGVEAPGQPTPQGIPPAQDPQRELKEFSTYVFTDSQRTWEGTFRRDGEPYEHAQLVLYSDAVNTDGCGSATSAVGPFSESACR
jgi:predicted metalloprotease